MIAASAPGRLLIGEKDGAVRRAIAGRGDGIGVGGSGDAGKVQLAGEEQCRRVRIRGRRDRTSGFSRDPVKSEFPQGLKPEPFSWANRTAKAVPPPNAGRQLVSLHLKSVPLEDSACSRAALAGLRGDGHGDVGGAGGVGERADADEVDAGLGVGASRVEHDSAGGFGGNPAAGLSGGHSFDALDGAADFSGRHVVEQDGLGAVSESFVELLRGADFDLHALTVACAGQARGKEPPRCRRRARCDCS